MPTTEPFLVPPAPDTPPAAAEAVSFSIVVAAYNAASTIGDALSSALAQTAPAQEIIVCDDGSTDNLAAALEPFAGQIEVIHQENAGEAAAKNAGIAHTSGTFVVFLDADDRFAPTRLERLAALAAARPDLDILTTDAHLLVGERRVARCYGPTWTFDVDDQRAAILQRNFIFGLAAVRRWRVQEVGGFDTAFTHATDWDLWLRLIVGGSRAGLVAEPLADYRLNPASLSANRALLLAGRAAVLRKAAGLSALTGAERKSVLAGARRERAGALTVEAHQALRDRRPEARSLSARLACSRAVPLGTRVKSLLAAAVPGPAAASILRSEERNGVAGPAGVRFDAAAEASVPTPTEPANR